MFFFRRYKAFCMCGEEVDDIRNDDSGGYCRFDPGLENS
jgi:hypothetical protein